MNTEQKGWIMRMNRFRNRKLTAMALAVLVGTTGMTAFAGAPAPSGTGYDAYKLMPAVKELKDGCGHEDDGSHEDGCYDYVYSVNEKYQEILKKATAGIKTSFDLDGDGELSDEELVAGISSLDKDDATAYADALYAAIGDMEPDAVTDGSVFEGMEDGFYLFASKAADGEGQGSPVTVLLKAVHEQSEDMEVQVHVPAFSQKILLPKADDADSIATPDNAIQVVQEVRAEADEDADTEEDTDEDTDTEEDADTDSTDTDEDADTDGTDTDEDADTDGTDTDEDADTDGTDTDSAQDETGDGTDGTDKDAGNAQDGSMYEETDAADIGAGDEVLFEAKLGMPECIEDLQDWGFSIHVKTDGLKLSQGPKLFVNGKEARVRGDAGADAEDGFTSGTISIKGAHLTVDGEDVDYDKDTVITMRYACTLDEGHVTGGIGNTSEAWAEFMPDMSDASKNMETVHDKNSVFTYQLNVNSVDAEHKELAGADFSLARQDGEDWVDIDLSGTKEDGQTSFSFAALDAGVYRLSETEIPAGCVKADDLVFEIRPEYDKDSEDPLLTALNVYVDGKLASSGDEGSLFTADKESGTIHTELINGVAAHMPSTGSNTRIILVAGGFALLMAGGSIYAAYQKKSKKDER